MDTSLGKKVKGGRQLGQGSGQVRQESEGRGSKVKGRSEKCSGIWSNARNVHSMFSSVSRILRHT